MPGAVVTRRCCMVVITLVDTIAIRATLCATTNLMRPWISSCTSSDCGGAPRVSTTAPHGVGAFAISSLAAAMYCSACSTVRLPVRVCSKIPPGSHSIVKDPATAHPFSVYATPRLPVRPTLRRRLQPGELIVKVSPLGVRLYEFERSHIGVVGLAVTPGAPKQLGAGRMEVA